MTALAPRVRDALQALERQGSAKVRGEQRTRYGIVAQRAYGVPMAAIQRLARQLGKDHDLATGLWESGWYEARLLAAYVDEPARVTPRQMDRWAREWDNWAVVDTHCFVLFDRTVHAWTRVTRWSGRREEFVRRGAFALLACLALHDKTAPERRFVAALPLIERAAGDSRNFVRKAVAWAQRAMAGRSPSLRRRIGEQAARFALATDPEVQWLGRATLRELKLPVPSPARGDRPAPRARRRGPSRGVRG